MTNASLEQTIVLAQSVSSSCLTWRKDWNNLVDDVLKEEVDQFFIESGVQGLHIRKRTNSWCVSQPTTLSEHGWASPSNTSSCSSNTFNNWKPSGSQDPRNTKENFPSPINDGCWEKKKTEPKESSASKTQQDLICTNRYIVQLPQTKTARQTKRDYFKPKL